MTTSGTTAFNSTVLEIIEDAYELVGGEFITGYDAKMARRFLNFLLIDLQNKGHPLGNLEHITVDNVSGQRDYTLDSDIIDVLHVTLKRDGVETEMRRVSLYEDNAIPYKAQQGRPFQYTIDRQIDAPVMKIWPTAESDSDTFEAWVMRKVEDVTASRQTVDISVRFQPALVFGLAYFMSYRRPDMDVQKRQELKVQYEELLENALGEDRERASFFAKPKINRPLR